MQTIKTLVLGSLLFFIMTTAHAAVTPLINYQGYLTDSGGTPINGTANLALVLYDAPVGGSVLWSESLGGVSVSNGIFNVQLGTSTAFGATVFDNPTVYLGVSVDGDSEMTPRTQLVSVPYALRAQDSDTVDGLDASDFAPLSHTTDVNPHSISAAMIGAATTANLASHAGNAAAHHSRYADAEAVSAMGILGDSNALNHNRYSNTNAVAAILAADGPSSGLNADLLDGLNSTAFMTAATDNWVNITGDTMSGNLNVLARIGVGTATPAYALDVRGGTSTYLGVFLNDNNATGSTYGIYASGDARGTGTGQGRGGYFMGYGGSTSGTAYGTSHYAYANGSSTAYGIYSYAIGGNTTGREWAFYGMGDSYFSGDVGIGTNTPDTRLSLTGTGSTNGLKLGQGQATAINIYHTAVATRITGPGGRIQFGTLEYIEDCGASCIAVSAGKFGMGTSTPATPLHINASTDASFANGSGVILIGAETSGNLVIDGNEIIARNNGLPAKLYLNNGGTYVVVPGLQITGGADLVEPFDVRKDEKVEPGMVMAIDPNNPGHLRIASNSYDRTVAGIVSGANGINPGLSMAQTGSIADGSHPIALTGRLYALADASYSDIQPGDLLTTSNTLGHVMKVTDYTKAHGAIIGKAMTPLKDGKGYVLVLVSLQ